MNLSIIYELRDRLESIAIAGIGLIKEDFRLKKLAERLEEYSKAAPVFKQIYDMLIKLQDETVDNKTSILLDLIGLTDALICTQAKSCMDGEVTELEYIQTEAYEYKDIAYSRIKPVAESFLSTGSGRYALIRDAYGDDKELFKDIRIKKLMIKALGDSYSELADMVADWLMQEDESMVELLKNDFDKQGNRQMQRRLSIIAGIMKEKDNDFYISLLDTDSKEVKEEAIRSLKYSNDNIDLLLDLSKTEKGKLKEAVNEAISSMKSEKAVDYWTKLASIKAAEAARYLINLKEEWSANIVVDMIRNYMTKNPITKDTSKEDKIKIQTGLSEIWRSTQGKYSSAIEELSYEVYRIIPDEVIRTLNNSINMNTDIRAYEMAKNLYAKCGKKFLKSVFMAALFFESKEDLYEKYHQHLKDIKTSHEKNIVDDHPILSVLHSVYYDKKLKSYKFSDYMYYTYYGYNKSEDKILNSGFDTRWYDILFDIKDICIKAYKQYYSRYGNYYSQLLARLYNPELKLDEKYVEYFYDECINRKPTPEAISLLKRLNWKDFVGVLSKVDSMDTLRRILKVADFDREFVINELGRLISSKSLNKNINIKTLTEWQEYIQNGMDYNDLPW